MVGHLALGVGAAVAGVHTLVVEAGLGLGTVVIGGAAHCNTLQLGDCNIILEYLNTFVFFCILWSDLLLF